MIIPIWIEGLGSLGLKDRVLELASHQFQSLTHYLKWLRQNRKVYKVRATNAVAVVDYLINHNNF